MTRPILLPILAATALAAGAATAQPAAPASAPMTFQQVVERVAAAGYRDLREVEREGDKLYEVKARDGQGRRVELTVDARTGEVLREEVKR